MAKSSHYKLNPHYNFIKRVYNKIINSFGKIKMTRNIINCETGKARDCNYDFKLRIDTSQYILYVKKNIGNFIIIGDIRNINTRYRSKLIAPETRLHRLSNSFHGIICTLL